MPEPLSARARVLVPTLWLGRVGLTAPASAERVCAPSAVAARIAADMSGAHDGRMHGVPDTFDWAAGPRVGMGNDPGGFTALIPWGQVYEAADGNPARNARVAVRDIAVWVLGGRSGIWTRATGSRGIDGANYAEDFGGDRSRPADLRREPDGSVSATLGNGFNVHFWSTLGRAVIDPDDVAGVLSLFDARLVRDRDDRPDDRRRARLLASAGADYWLDRTARWDEWTTNGDAGIGKARWVVRRWRTFAMSTLDARALAAYPPPVCLRG